MSRLRPSLPLQWGYHYQFLTELRCLRCTKTYESESQFLTLPSLGCRLSAKRGSYGGCYCQQRACQSRSHVCLKVHDIFCKLFRCRKLTVDFGHSYTPGQSSVYPRSCKLALIAEGANIFPVHRLYARSHTLEGRDKSYEQWFLLA